MDLKTLPKQVALYSIAEEMDLFLSPGAALSHNGLKTAKIRRTDRHISTLHEICPRSFRASYDMTSADIRRIINFEDWVSPTARSLLASISVMPGVRKNFTFSLDTSKCHGPAHWLRVSYWGINLLLRHSGIRNITIPNIVGTMSSQAGEFISCFAVLHDLCRHTDDDDPHHGRRIVQFLLSEEGWPYMALIGKAIGKTNMPFFITALAEHNKGTISRHPWIGLCWDADRYDLTRTFEIPDPALLSTAAARESLWTL